VIVLPFSTFFGDYFLPYKASDEGVEVCPSFLGEKGVSPPLILTCCEVCGCINRRVKSGEYELQQALLICLVWVAILSYLSYCMHN
jgi:hypothetical protein